MPTCATNRTITTPIGHELSSLASQRESDALGQGYKRGNRSNVQQDSNTAAILELTRKLEKMRRRILGGGSAVATTTTQTGWNYRGMYDPAAVSLYLSYDVIQFGSGTSAGMYLCLIDGNTYAPDSGIGWVQISTGTGTWL